MGPLMIELALLSVPLVLLLLLRRRPNFSLQMGFELLLLLLRALLGLRHLFSTITAMMPKRSATPSGIVTASARVLFDAACPYVICVLSGPALAWVELVKSADDIAVVADEGVSITTVPLDESEGRRVGVELWIDVCGLIASTAVGDGAADDFGIQGRGKPLSPTCASLLKIATIVRE